MNRQLSARHFIPLCRASAALHARLRQRVPYGVTIFSSPGLYHCPSTLRAQAFRLQLQQLRHNFLLNCSLYLTGFISLCCYPVWVSKLDCSRPPCCSERAKYCYDLQMFLIYILYADLWHYLLLFLLYQTFPHDVPLPSTAYVIFFLVFRCP